MSDKKFNLKNYKKIDGNEPIGSRLMTQHEEAPNVLNEKQLEDYRGTEANTTIEKLLEKSRTGEETEVTEKRLDTHKSKFANKYRNEEAYSGDMNKLEEKRLKGDASEKEKYERASETPKQLRWWEEKKGPDGLKLAKTEGKKVVTAQEKDEKFEEMAFDKPRFDEVGEEEEPVEYTKPEPRVLEDFPVDDVTDAQPVEQSRAMDVEKAKYIPNEKYPGAAGIYMVMTYDPLAFTGDEDAIHMSAREKVLSIHPELEDVRDLDDYFSIPKEVDGKGYIKFTAHGEQFADTAKAHSGTPSTEQGEVLSDVGTENPVTNVSEISYEEKDMGGTPMAVGRLKVDPNGTPEDILRASVHFIEATHPNITVDEQSLDMSKASEGEVSYMVGITSEPEPETVAGTDFDIVVESASKKK